MEKRPSGVTILSATSVIAGLLMLINGSMLASFAPPQLKSEYAIAGMQVQMPWLLGSSLVYGLGTIMFAVGIASFFVAWGLLRGEPWARKAMIAFTGIGIAIFAASAALFNFVEMANIIINGSILAYLFKPSVKAFFSTLPARAPKTAP